MSDIYFSEWNDIFNPIIHQPVLSGLGMLANEKHWLGNRHLHKDHIELLFVHRGTGKVFIDGIWHPIDEGCLICYNPMQEHQEDFRESSETPVLYVCSFAELVVKGLVPGHIVPPGVVPVFPTYRLHSMISTCFVEIYQECCRQRLGYEQIVHSRLETLVLCALRLINRQMSPAAAVYDTSLLAMHAKSFIDGHYQQNITLRDAARELHVSLYHLSHIFTEHIGIPPIQYLICRRMSEAKRLLHSSSLSVQEIARRVGYNNCSYFNMQFRKLFKVSPARYRIQVRSVDDNSNPWTPTLSPPSYDGNEARIMYEVRKCRSTI